MEFWGCHVDSSMTQTASDRPSPDRPVFDLHRFRAAIALRGQSMDAVARRCRVTPRHLAFVVMNQRRPSAQLLARVKDQLGEAVWAFVIGKVDILIAEGTSHAAA